MYLIGSWIHPEYSLLWHVVFISGFNNDAVPEICVYKLTVWPLLSGLPLSESLYYPDAISPWFFFFCTIITGKGGFQTQSEFLDKLTCWPYDAVTNIGCLPLRSEMNYGNIRLRMTLQPNVGCLPLRSEMNYGNIRLRYDAKQNVGCLPYVRKWITVHSAPYDAKTNVGCLPLRSDMTLR